MSVRCKITMHKPTLATQIHDSRPMLFKSADARDMHVLPSHKEEHTFSYPNPHNVEGCHTVLLTYLHRMNITSIVIPQGMVLHHAHQAVMKKTVVGCIKGPNRKGSPPADMNWPRQGLEKISNGCMDHLFQFSLCHGAQGGEAAMVYLQGPNVQLE